MKKILLTILLTIFTFSILSNNAFAYKVIKRDELGIDESIADQTRKKIAYPSKILVSRISTSVEDYSKDSSLWVKSIYYYSITRQGFLDLPYSYLIDRDGNIFEGRQGGVYTDPETQNTNGTIVIGYLSNYEDITILATNSLKSVIQEVSYQYGIEYKNTDVVTMKIVKGDLDISKVGFEKDNTVFGNQLYQIMRTFKYSNSEHLDYIAQVKDLNYTKTVNSTEVFNVTYSLVNMNDFPWFTSRTPIYISTKDKKDSAFAVNDKWESFSKPGIIENKIIMPGESVPVSFDLYAMVLPGKYTQKFVATKLPNIVFENSNITLDFTVKKGNKKLVKVVDIVRLNVRECPGPTCKVLTQVGENQMFIMLEASAGWYKIKYSDTKSGWVYGKYIQPL